MGVRTVVLAAVLVSATSDATPRSLPDAIAELAREVQRVAGAPWRVRLDPSTITLSREFTAVPPGAFAAAAGETGMYRIVLTVEPYVDDAAQRKRLTAARKREAALWRAVARFECQEKSFADHYIDGLCFHTRRDSDERRVLAYRKARDVTLNVPRYHRGSDFAVALRSWDGEPTDAQCGSECDAVVDKLAAMFEEYPR